MIGLDFAKRDFDEIVSNSYEKRFIEGKNKQIYKLMDSLKKLEEEIKYLEFQKKQTIVMLENVKNELIAH